MATFYRRRMTFAGGVQYDAPRHANPVVDGDGLAAFDRSVGLWEATTNLCTNGGFETNTAGWDTSGFNAIASDAGQAKFGSRSCLAIYQNNNNLLRFAVTLSAAKHTFSCWVYVPSDYNGGGVQLLHLNFAGATGEASADANMALRDRWQRLDLTFTPAAGGLSGELRVDNTGAAPTPGRFIYVDGVQIEGQPIATPYVETNGSTATRAAGRITAPGGAGAVLGGQLDQLWVVARVRPRWAYNDAPGEGLGGAGDVVFNCGSSTDFVRLWYREASTDWRVRVGQSGVVQDVGQASTFAGGDVLTVAGFVSPTQIGVSVNGAAFTTAARTRFPAVPAATQAVDLLSDGASSHFDGECLWALVGTGRMTNDVVRALHAVGNRKPTPYDVPDLSELSLLWTCEDGYAMMREQG